MSSRCHQGAHGVVVSHPLSGFNPRCVHFGHRFHKQARQNTTPVGLEPTRGDPIGLAGRRLNRSAKVSLVRSARESIRFVVPAMDAPGVGYVFPTDFEAVVQRSSMRAAQHGATDPPRNLRFPKPLFFEPFRSPRKQIFAWDKKNLPMAHEPSAPTIEPREHSYRCGSGLRFHRARSTRSIFSVTPSRDGEFL